MCYLYGENKDTYQQRGYCAAELSLCFCICKKQIFSRHCSIRIPSLLFSFSFLVLDIRVLCICLCNCVFFFINSMYIKFTFCFFLLFLRQKKVVLHCTLVSSSRAVTLKMGSNACAVFKITVVLSRFVNTGRNKFLSILMFTVKSGPNLGGSAASLIPTVICR